MVLCNVAETWRQTMFSPITRFIEERVAKKPYKLSLLGSLAVTAFIPLIMITALILGPLLVGFILLISVQCGFITMALVSTMPFIAIALPTALAVTCCVYTAYRCIIIALNVIQWILSLPRQCLDIILHEVGLVWTGIQAAVDHLCFWRHLKGNKKKEITAAVRSRAEKRITERTSQLLSDSDDQQSIRTAIGTQQKQRGIVGNSDDSRRVRGEDYRVERRRINKNPCNSRGFLSWFWIEEQRIKPDDNGNGYRPSWRRNEEFESHSLSSHMSELNYSSVGEIGRLSGTSSDSLRTAEEWIVENEFGEIAPDYRDSQMKMYDFLLKRDFSQGYY